jgi:hypothetical protein
MEHWTDEEVQQYAERKIIELDHAEVVNPHDVGYIEYLRKEIAIAEKEVQRRKNIQDKMYEFNIGDKVYFAFPGIVLSGVIEGLFTADVPIAKVHLVVQGHIECYYLPLNKLHTKLTQWTNSSKRLKRK